MPATNSQLQLTDTSQFQSCQMLVLMSVLCQTVGQIEHINPKCHKGVKSFNVNSRPQSKLLKRGSCVYTLYSFTALWANVLSSFCPLVIFWSLQLNMKLACKCLGSTYTPLYFKNKQMRIRNKLCSGFGLF